jgi:hypothetical protein
MFVKVRRFDRNNLKGETVYKCETVSIHQITPEPPNTEVTEMALIIDDRGSNEKTVIIPCDSKNDETVEIYLMNNEGKTIDSYRY